MSYGPDDWPVLLVEMWMEKEEIKTGIVVVILQAMTSIYSPYK